MAKARKKKVVKKAKKAKKAKKVRCSGKTSDGKRCKRWVALPRKRCYQHK
jgi:hypothetical protein